MTKLEVEKYLLALNDGQRLALLLALFNQVKSIGLISLEKFEGMITAYQPITRRKREE